MIEKYKRFGEGTAQSGYPGNAVRIDQLVRYLTAIGWRGWYNRFRYGSAAPLIRIVPNGVVAESFHRRGSKRVGATVRVIRTAGELDLLTVPRDLHRFVRIEGDPMLVELTS